MAQEDKGLIVRGIALLAVILVLVTIVVTIVLWRPSVAEPPTASAPEHHIPAAVLPSLAPFPSGVSWYAVFKLGETMPSAPGRDIRYNAAATLARRGSAQVPWPLIREMLDEKLQMRNNRVRLPDGRDVYDEAAARANVISALKALAAWHEKQADKKAPGSELREIYGIVDQLAASPFGELKIQAEKARATFFR